MGMDLSDRSEYIGVHVKPGVKIALEAEREKSGTSMSKMVSDLLEDAMTKLGYDIGIVERMPGERPLPLDEPQEFVD